MMYDFRTSVQSIVKGPLSWVKVNAKLAFLWELLKEYPMAVHFESKHYVRITTTYDLHQNDGCSVWHIPIKQAAAVWWTPD